MRIRTALPKQLEQRGAARLLGEPCPGNPEQRRLPNRVMVEVGGQEVHVRGLWLTVEEQREVVGRMNLAEHDWRPQFRVGAHPTGVDAEPLQRFAHERPETVVADLRDHRRARPEAGRLHRDVGGGPAQILRERLDLGEWNTDLLRVKIDPDPPGCDHVIRWHDGGGRRDRGQRRCGDLPPGLRLGSILAHECTNDFTEARAVSRRPRPASSRARPTYGRLRP